MTPPTLRSLKSCNNPSCSDFGVINRDSLLKCGKCKTATYCNKDCQRAHWPVHKQFCKVWQDTAANSGEGVRDIKKKMNEFIWLVRSVPDYTDELFRRYISMLREGTGGCVEFIFETSDELDEAIRVLRSLRVVGEAIFRTMPKTPAHQENPDGLPITLRRRSAKGERVFIKAVDEKMAFIDSHGETRPNLLTLLSMVGSSERMLVLCVTMRLAGTFATHSYDFLFKDLSWCSDDVPTSSRRKLAIEGPDDSPALRRKISFELD
ncbi:hypothetical protein B0H11DRAFT_1977045 [Mycena galericulata]|nr:hypothetical protein B0H11DRAFT_2016680 [Mycena galericulata]KAJ7505146.1 hypothetical protein B0H11DRAFT_1977045 [Mycena galericulata]